MAPIHKSFLEVPSIQSLRVTLNSVTEQLGKDTTLLQVLNPDKWKSNDYGTCPEDEYELRKHMEDMYEFVVHVWINQEVRGYLEAASFKKYKHPAQLTLHDIDQIFLWSYRI